MTTSDKILSIEPLQDKLSSLKKEGKKIVFTNGCFDLIHVGHIDYLEKARNLADFLVVGLNSDQSVKILKGINRPLLDQNARSRILAAMTFVDAVILFNEETPYQLIKAIRPDFLVKGNDYIPENIIGADIVKSYGGKVITIELMEGYSTTVLINKAKNS